MADDKKKDEAAAAPKKSKKMLIIILLAVLLLGAGGGAGWYFFLKPKPDASAEAEEEPKPVTKDKAKPKVFSAFEPFTVNLADEGGTRLAQIDIVLEVRDAAVGTEITAQMPAMRNAVLMLLSAKYARELLSVPGKEKLADEIAIAAGAQLGWEPPDDEEEEPPRRSKGKAGAESATDEADPAAKSPADKKPKKRKKRRADPNPVHAVHFAKFLVQ